MKLLNLSWLDAAVIAVRRPDGRSQPEAAIHHQVGTSLKCEFGVGQPAARVGLMGRHLATSSLRITAADVQGRADATRLARTDRRAAFAIARRIVHPWYRCQALTAVAEEIEVPRERMPALLEAIDSAYEQEEPNRIASVGAWPLRAMAAIDIDAARPQVERFLKTIAKEPHGLRRLDGLRGILGAVLTSKELRALVLPAFRHAATASAGWRTERLVAFMAEALGEYDVDAADELLRQRSANRFSLRARAVLRGLQTPQ